MKVLVASPFANDNSTLGYTATVAWLSQLLAERGVPFDYYPAISGDVVLNRNVIAHRFLSDPDATHLIMLDSDMQVEKSVFAHFLAQDHEFMGAVYARRKIDLARFHAEAQAGKDVGTAKALASDFIVHFPSTRVAFENHFTPVTGIGLGCVMIARRVFQSILDAGLAPQTPDKAAHQFGIGNQYHDFFRTIRHEDGSMTSEDYAFCQRATQSGTVQIMGYIGPGVHHTGQFQYSTAYDLVLRDLMKPQDT
ncbi:MAG: hypothetical protein AAGL96_04205 [Pseudomonadota bacterium]